MDVAFATQGFLLEAINGSFERVYYMKFMYHVSDNRDAKCEK